MAKAHAIRVEWHCSACKKNWVRVFAIVPGVPVRRFLPVACLNCGKLRTAVIDDTRDLGEY